MHDDKRESVQWLGHKAENWETVSSRKNSKKALIHRILIVMKVPSNNHSQTYSMFSETYEPKHRQGISGRGRMYLIVKNSLFDSKEKTKNEEELQPLSRLLQFIYCIGEDHSKTWEMWAEKIQKPKTQLTQVLPPICTNFKIITHQLGTSVVVKVLTGNWETLSSRSIFGMKLPW